MSDRSLAYRPEIDGLRAIAVVAVILCHGGFLRLAPGGFLGVDLFFVVSGYLITGILARELTEERFSIWRFYERRIRRIIPALMLVMLLCIPIAFWLMLPDDLENFGQSLVGTTLFANNIVLLLTSGYFAIETLVKPLMHTWSLGVEEQYYLVVPLMMSAAWRIGKARGVLIGVAAVTALSFAACLWMREYMPTADFLLIVSRGWELGAGSLAALVEHRIRPRAGPRIAAALALTGLGMAVLPILFGFITYAPGARHLIPVLGVCLILLFGGTRDPAGRLLSSKPFVAIGLISYSAYLFHQPIFAFARLASPVPLSQTMMAALLVPVFLSAWASWRFVEQPCRDRNRVSTGKLLIGSALAAKLVLAIGLTLHFTGGFYKNWPELYDPTIQGNRPHIAYNEGAMRYAGVKLPVAHDKVGVLVIGNSFARDFINMLELAGPRDRHRISLTHYQDCYPLSPDILANARNADFVVLSTRFRDRDVPCIADRVKELRGATSARIIIIGRKSFGYNNNALMLMPREQRLRWRAAPLPEAIAANEAARRAFGPDLYVDMIGLLADGQGRVAVFTPDGKFISQDREHLTRYGAIYVTPIIFRHPALQALLNARPAPQKP